MNGQKRLIAINAFYVVTASNLFNIVQKFYLSIKIQFCIFSWSCIFSTVAPAPGSNQSDIPLSEKHLNFFALFENSTSEKPSHLDTARKYAFSSNFVTKSFKQTMIQDV